MQRHDFNLTMFAELFASELQSVLASCEYQMHVTCYLQGHAASADLPVTRENMREMSERRASMRASFRQAAPADAAAA